jgi:hypothetical protein
MNISVHIDRLVLDGLTVTPAQGPKVEDALRRELTLLLVAHGLPEKPAGAVAVPHRQAPAIRLPADARPDRLGSEIAHAVYSGIAELR